MLNNNNLGLYLIASPVVLIVTCLVLVLPVNAIMQWKHMLHAEVDFSTDMSSIASYLQMIPLSWVFIIATLCTYKVSNSSNKRQVQQERKLMSSFYDFRLQPNTS